MRDKSGAHVAPAGSGLGILPANSGGVATQQRAPGHERPRTASSDAARHGRLSAASTAPGYDVPRAITVRAPGHDCQSAAHRAHDHFRSRPAPRAPGHDRPLAASSGVAGHDRPCATPGAPGADVPPATAAEAPGQHRLSAVPAAPDHNRSAARHQRAPGHERPRTASSDTARHGRLSAASTAPGHDVPLATLAGAPGHGRLRAGLATASVPDHSPVSPPPALDHDCSRRVPVTAGSPSASVTHPTTLEETVYDRIVTKQDVQRTGASGTAPLLRSASKHLGSPKPQSTGGRRSTLERSTAQPATTHVYAPLNLCRSVMPPRPPALRGGHRRASTLLPLSNMLERGPGDGPKPHHTWHYPCGFGPSVGEDGRPQPAPAPTSKNKKGALPMIAEWLIVPISIALGLLAAWVEHSRLRRIP